MEGTSVDKDSEASPDALKSEEQDGTQSAEEMIKLLSDAEKTIAATVAGAAEYADANGDTATHDLLIGRQLAHEKFAWMLRAHLA